MLERFIAGFRLVNGATFQVPIGNGCCADFMIEGAIVEYHHLRFYSDGRRFGDFSCEEEYREFRRKSRRVRSDRWKREKLFADTRQTLLENYFLKRRRLLDRNPAFTGCDLIVAASTDELYENVLRRFAPACPPRGSFIRAYHELIRDIARASAGTPRPEQKAA